MRCSSRCARSSLREEPRPTRCCTRRPAPSFLGSPRPCADAHRAVCLRWHQKLSQQQIALTGQQNQAQQQMPAQHSAPPGRTAPEYKIEQHAHQVTAPPFPSPPPPAILASPPFPRAHVTHRPSYRPRSAGESRASLRVPRRPVPQARAWSNQHHQHRPVQEVPRRAPPQGGLPRCGGRLRRPLPPPYGGGQCHQAHAPDFLL